jgi:transcriptional regulator with XRE-family HTH domain
MSFAEGVTMKLCDKLRYLREVEGSLRGLGRAMTQGELVKAISTEMDTSMSQSYLSQIESGARPHLTNTTRLLLAKFFKVHPGYLVDDPEGYHAELMSDVRGLEDKLDLWLIGGAERFRRDPELRRALLAVARHEDSRACLLLLESVLETPKLADRLMELLRPQAVKPMALVEPAAKAKAAKVSTKGSSKDLEKANKGAAR